jgi:hypothetical protein
MMRKLSGAANGVGKVVTRLIQMIAFGLAAILAGPVVGVEHDGGAPEAISSKPGVALYGERLMRYRVLPEGGGSGHFDPPLPLDDKAMLLGAMKAVARVVYGDHRIEVEDMSAFKPRIGRTTKVSDLDFDYSFLLDGSQRGGVSVILVQRTAVKRTIDEDQLLKELEAL